MLTHLDEPAAPGAQAHQPFHWATANSSWELTRNHRNQFALAVRAVNWPAKMSFDVGQCSPAGGAGGGGPSVATGGAGGPAGTRDNLPQLYGTRMKNDGTL